MAQSLLSRLSNFAKSGSAYGQTGLALAADVVAHFYQHNGNVDPARRLIAAAVTDADKRDFCTILGTFLPVTVKDGTLTVQKNWAKKAENLPRINTAGFKSFRDFAASLRPDVQKEEKPFDTMAYLALLAAVNTKARKKGGVSEALLKQMEHLVGEMAMALANTTPGKATPQPVEPITKAKMEEALADNVVDLAA